MDIGHVNTILYGFIELEKVLVDLLTTGSASASIDLDIAVMVGYANILWVPTCFITNENPGDLLQLIVVWTERVC